MKISNGEDLYGYHYGYSKWGDKLILDASFINKELLSVINKILGNYLEIEHYILDIDKFKSSVYSYNNFKELTDINCEITDALSNLWYNVREFIQNENIGEFISWCYTSQDSAELFKEIGINS